MIAYSPFGSPDLPWGKKMPHILADPVINEIAERMGKSPAQVVEYGEFLGIITDRPFDHVWLTLTHSILSAKLVFFKYWKL